MAGLFSKPKTPKPPPLPPPAAIPEVEDEETKRAVRPRRSRAATIVTGELEPQTSKKSLLG